MSPFAAYRTLFGLTGVAYVLIAFAARIPLAMSQLGVLMLIADTTGSYGAGGACAGALAVANAVGATWWGSLADRVGQRGVVLVQSIGSALGIIAVLVVAHADLAWGWAALAATLTGFLLPQVGPLARARWRPIARGERNEDTLVATAFSYEGAADEASFVLGPALVGVFTAVWDPTVALVMAAALLLVFGSAFGAHRTARTTGSTAPSDAADLARLLTPALVLLCLAQLSIGMVFGSVQNATNVLATEAGQQGLTGLFHALLGVGSVVAGLTMGALPRRWPMPDRLRWFALAFLVLALPLLAVDSLAMLVPVLLVLGLTVAPFMITTFTLGERVTDPRRIGAAMTLLAGATGLGYAVGAAVSGRLADEGGQTPAFGVTVAAGVLMCLVAWLGRSTLANGMRTQTAAETGSAHA